MQSNLICLNMLKFLKNTGSKNPFLIKTKAKLTKCHYHLL